MGGALLGMGMTLAGFCPGMVFAQLGAGVSTSLFTLAGGLAGVYLYAALEPTIRKTFAPTRSGAQTQLGGSFETLALSSAMTLLAFVAFLEYLVPWNAGIVNDSKSLLAQRAWPPIAAGVLVGMLQLPAVLVLGDTLGSATAYCTVAAQVPGAPEKLPYLQKYKSGASNWWQVFYLGSALVGAATAHRWGPPGDVVSGVSPGFAFTGGMLALFGARLAGGCTSGHGLSGAGLLGRLSLLAVPAMFAGGMGTAFGLRALHVL